ncbi:hypothetical protein [Photobacterium galatheae]|uniref:Uncharacterized protein n=1 Tax=Photobacterium galatheae TaxID=1654360 RepID=A0A066RH28_9GAMM|nr:hypothetical protein [Photobacterium galatheae]KDM89725.1 hypothetical protein EA58_21195 [Photobacterium galatheae]MCM0151523.1 hypothetical protein [Photobacterium galatheae]
MLEVEFTHDGSRCTPELFIADPEKYEGLIVCIECRKRAWFTKGFTTVKGVERTACFGSHHEDGCNRASSILEAEDMEGIETDENGDNKSADIFINLDKTKHGQIEKSVDNDKTDAPPHNWEPSPKPIEIGGKSGYPMEKSLRQILSYLVRNELYGEGKSVKIVADSGRVLIEGMLRDQLVQVPYIEERHYQKEKIFWGEINNYKELDDGTVWLNYGTKREPSIYVPSDLKQDLMDKYHMKDLSRFHGSHFIVVGVVGRSPHGKPIIRSAFPKYMNFINYREKEFS